MSFLPSLSDGAALLDVFKTFPDTAIPLLQYHECLMRGTSPLSVQERELIAAYVSALNSCDYCFGVHAVVARQFGVPENLVRGLVESLESVEIDARLRSLLLYVKKVTLNPNRMCSDDAKEVFAAGWSEKALHDAVSVCALFNFMNRFVEGLGIKENPDYSKLSGERLSSGGYLGLIELLNPSSDVQA